MNDQDIKRIETHLRRTFGAAQILLKPRPKQKDSAEVYIGEEFIGVLFVDDEDDDRGGGFGDECWRAPDPLTCWLEKLGGVGRCLQGCAETIEAGLDECSMTASACRDACEKPPGSASRAFVAKPGSLLD